MNLVTFKAFRQALRDTLSDDPEEVLRAIRAANIMLAADNQTWDTLLQGKVNCVVGVFDTPPLIEKGGETATREEIEYWLEELLTGKLSPGFREFVESIASQFHSGRQLTSAQIGAVKEAYERATNPRSFSGRRDR